MQRKKVGVLTFHRSLNYGAVLQAYGLVKSVEKLGYPCEIIDYRNELLENRDSIKRFIKTKEIMRAGYQYVEMPFWFIRRYRFNKFLELANVGKRVKQIDKPIEDNYGKFLVGSDQVWNYKVTDLDKNYFFNNVNDQNKKNSYAASFGVSNIPEEYKEKYVSYLSSFNKITVREKAGATIVKDLIGEEPSVVLDPSLLLTKEDWKSLIGERKINGDYIVIYQRAYSKTLLSYAQKLAKDNKCKIVTINGNPRQLIKAKYILDAGPIEWLNIMFYSKYIVTNSFHGVAFAINFNKQFFVELLDEKFGVNSRLDNIIELFGLENRIIKQGESSRDLEELDFKKINSKLNLARENSLGFLQSILES